jgi:hypothetical protein
MVVDISPPFGEFYLDPSAHTPIVLISGGVGEFSLHLLFLLSSYHNSHNNFHYQNYIL